MAKVNKHLASLWKSLEADQTPVEIAEADPAQYQEIRELELRKEVLENDNVAREVSLEYDQIMESNQDIVDSIDTAQQIQQVLEEGVDMSRQDITTLKSELIKVENRCAVEEVKGKSLEDFAQLSVSDMKVSLESDISDFVTSAVDKLYDVASASMKTAREGLNTLASHVSQFAKMISTKSAMTHDKEETEREVQFYTHFLRQVADDKNRYDGTLLKATISLFETLKQATEKASDNINHFNYGDDSLVPLAELSKDSNKILFKLLFGNETLTSEESFEFKGIGIMTSGKAVKCYTKYPDLEEKVDMYRLDKLSFKAYQSSRDTTSVKVSEAWEIAKNLKEGLDKLVNVINAYIDECDYYLKELAKFKRSGGWKRFNPFSATNAKIAEILVGLYALTPNFGWMTTAIEAYWFTKSMTDALLKA